MPGFRGDEICKVVEEVSSKQRFDEAAAAAEEELEDVMISLFEEKVDFAAFGEI